MGLLKSTVKCFLVAITLKYSLASNASRFLIAQTESIHVDCVLKLNEIDLSRLDETQSVLVDLSFPLQTQHSLEIQQKFLANTNNVVIFNNWKCEESNKLRRTVIHVYFVLEEFQTREKLSIKNLVKQWKLCDVWNPLGKIVILFINQDKHQLLSPVDIINDVLSESYTIDVDVLSLDVSSSVIVSSKFEFSKKCPAQTVAYLESIYLCGSSRPILLNSTYKSDLFSHTQCSIQVNAMVWEPFVYQQRFYLQGLDIVLIRSLAEVLKVKLDVSYVSSKKKITEHIGISNMHGYGSPNRSIDLLIGGLMINHFEDSALISTTRPYAYDDLTWCFRKLEPHPLLINIYLMFSPDVWIVQVSAVTIIVFLWYLFLRYDGVYYRIQECLHLAFYIYAMSSITYRPKNGLVRLVLGIHMLGALLLNIIFCSVWIKGFTKSYNDEQVETYSQAFEQKNQFASDGKLSSFNDNRIFRKINDFHRYCSDIDECLTELRMNKKLGVAVSRAHAQSNPFLDKSRIICFSPLQHIYSYSVVMQSKEKYFYLLPEIDRCLGRFIESGLLNKWMSENQITEKIRKKIDKQFSETVNVANDGFVSSYHIRSSFFHLIITHLFSFAFLLLEIAVVNRVRYYARQRKKLPSYWCLLSRLLDEKRYFFLDAKKPTIF